MSKRTGREKDYIGRNVNVQIGIPGFGIAMVQIDAYSQGDLRAIEFQNLAAYRGLVKVAGVTTRTTWTAHQPAMERISA